MNKEELKKQLQGRSSDELREAMQVLYTANVPNKDELIETANVYSEVLKERGE